MMEYPDPYDNTTPQTYTNPYYYQSFPTQGQQQAYHEQERQHIQSGQGQQQIYGGHAYDEQAYREQVYRALNYQKVQPKSPAQKRISKAEVLDIVNSLKRWLIVGALTLFGLLAMLIGGQIASTNAQQSATPVSNPNSSFDQNTSSSGGFFQQQQGGGFFGNSGSSQAPFTNTRTS